MRYRRRPGGPSAHRARRRGSFKQPTTVAGKLGTSLFFLIFGGMGVAFLFFLGSEFWQAAQARTWPAVTATVTQSQLGRDADGDHVWEVVYRYEVDGRTYTSQAYNDVDQTAYAHDDYAVLQQLADQHPVGGKTTAYANPHQPSQAVLAHPSLWVGLFVLIPLVFVGVGIGGLYFTWRGSARGGAEEGLGQSRTSEDLLPTSQRVGKNKGRAALLLLGVVFTLVGGGISYFLVIKPLLNIRAAESWQPVPATVVSSQVKTHHDSDGNTYSVDILYEYEQQGQTYRSNRYSFFGGSSSAYHSKKRIVDHHPTGKQITIYVDPQNPASAVIERGYGEEWWIMFIPLVFLLVGLGMLVGGLFYKGSSGRSESQAWLPSTQSESHGQASAYRASTTTGATTLKPTRTALGQFVAALIFALVWNTGVGLFAYFVLLDGSGGIGGLGLLFFIPFALVGLVVIGAVFYFLLAMFNPKPVLEVNTASPALGDTLRIDWRLEGKVERVQRLHISLVGTEHATYTRGTDTVTDTHDFFEDTLVETADRNTLNVGDNVETVIPADTMHSFTADNNKITWQLRVRGDIRRWPDVKTAFELVIEPMPQEAMSYG